MKLLIENWQKYLNEGDVVDLSSHPKYKVHQTTAEKMKAADDLVEWGAEYFNSTRYDVTERHADLARFAEKAEELGLDLDNGELQNFIDCMVSWSAMRRYSALWTTSRNRRNLIIWKIFSTRLL